MMSLFLILVLIPGDGHKQLDHLSQQEFERFTDGMAACFVIRDMRRGTTTRYNQDLCALKYSPCSTFKIFNSLAALDAEVLADANTVLEWDGRPKWNKSWERDHTLATATQYSVVWYYKEVARRLGKQRMQAYLNKVGYGNRNISGGIDQFWLGSSLTISADEQLDFLERLYRNDLPFSQHAMDTTRNILVHQERGGARLSGKTGSYWKDGTYNLGWFVGHLTTVEGGEYVFAYNMAGKGASGIRARARCKDLLHALGLADFVNDKAGK